MNESRSGQLALALPWRERRDRESFVPAPCNAAALAFVDRWPEWPGPAALIVGPTGAGKTHLLSIWRLKSGAEPFDPERENFVDLMRRRPQAVAIDDADALAPRDPELFTHFLNWSRGEALPLLLTAASAPARWGVVLPDLVSRLQALPGAAIRAPDDALLRAVMEKLFSDRQVRINAKVIDYLLPRMARSLDAAVRLVAALDAAALQGGRAVTMALAEEILAEDAPPPE